MIGDMTPEEQEIYRSVAGAGTPLDLKVHLTNKDNLGLMRAHYPGLKISIEDKLSDGKHTAFSFESPKRAKAMVIQISADVELEHSDLDKLQPVNDFYAADRREGGDE